MNETNLIILVSLSAIAIAYTVGLMQGRRPKKPLARPVRRFEAKEPEWFSVAERN